MRASNIRRALIGLATGAMAALGATGASAQTYFPPDVDKSQCSLSAEEFQTWITLTLPGTSTPIGPVYDKTSGMAYIFPVDGPNFVIDNDHGGTGPVKCDFYKWGAQMFLWLTSTIDDGGTIPSSPSFPATLPYVFNSEFFYRLSADHQQLIAQGSLAGDNSKSLAIALRTAKSDDKDESIGQAGGSGVLLTQSDSPADASLTYYGVHVNRLYGYFTNINKAAKTPEQDFPTTGTEACQDIKYAMQNGYAENTVIAKLLYSIYCTTASPSPSSMELKSNTDAAMKAANVSSTSALTIPELEPAVDYLSMAVEVKSAWVDASAVADKSKHVLQNLEVPVYDRTDPNHWLMIGSETRELALVGMHVVGTVKDHPEMVWATIEHVSNAPDSTYYYTDTSGTVQTVSGPQPGSSWIYSNGTVVDSITLHARGCDGYPPPASCLNKTDIVSVGDNEVIGPNGNDPIEASNVTRLHPWGNVQSKTDSFAVSQTTQIISLNNDVMAHVKNLLAGDPRQYYYLSGAIWTSNGSIPDNGDYQYNTGSLILANTTMETFHQELSCFGCHYSSSSSDGLGVSHIYGGLNGELPKIPADHGAMMEKADKKKK
jgi:hypothetical protein